MTERRTQRVEEAEDLLRPDVEEEDTAPLSPPSPNGRPESPMARAEGALPQSPAPAAPAQEMQRAPRPRGRVSLAAPTHRVVKERAISGILFLASAVSILTTVGIIVVLLYESTTFFSHVSVLEFLGGRRWAPLFTPQSFGVLPLLAGSFLVAAGAAMVALPVGLASAIYLSEYAAPRTKSILKPALEVLAGVPTVVYGFFALTFITPMLKGIWPSTQVFNALSASIVVGIMIIPLVASLSEDAMSAVPRALREGAYALGATKLEVSVKTVVPAALSGIVASFILAVSRAIGETMIVAIAAGASPNLTLNPLESVQTMTAYIVQVSMGEVSYGTIEYQTIFAVGLTLFAITLLMNILSNMVLRRYREVYE